MTCGFSVSNIYVVVDGHDATRKKIGITILNQLYKVYNSNTLSLGCSEIYNMIRAPKLKDIRVFKRYPDTIVVKASKKIPMAVLQRDGQYFYIDDKGDSYHSAKTNKYRAIVITGLDSNLNIKSIMDVVRKNEFFAQNIVAASFIDKRRWDLYIFERGVRIMLPEGFLSSSSPEVFLSSIEKVFRAIDKSKWDSISYIDCRCGDIVLGL